MLRTRFFYWPPDSVLEPSDSSWNIYKLDAIQPGAYKISLNIFVIYSTSPHTINIVIL